MPVAVNLVSLNWKLTFTSSGKGLPVNNPKEVPNAPIIPGTNPSGISKFTPKVSSPIDKRPPPMLPYVSFSICWRRSSLDWLSASSIRTLVVCGVVGVVVTSSVCVASGSTNLKPSGIG